MTFRKTTLIAYDRDHSPFTSGARILACVRAIRWFGWGFGEPLLPVFILAFSQTFAEAGLFISTFQIVSLISLPAIGRWADNIPAKRLVIWSLIISPLVGLYYFLAGVSGMAVFIVLARATNGLAWELENIGIATYYRRVTGWNHIATLFGYLDTWANLAWICAALLGLILVLFMPIYYLLLGIAPFSIIACAVALKAPKESIESRKSNRFQPVHLQSKIAGLRCSCVAQSCILGILAFFSSIIGSFSAFFIPMTSYIAGANLPMVVLIAVVGAIPSLFGFKLGLIADRRNGYSIIAFALICIAIIAVSLALIHLYLFKLAAVFVMGIILELFYVVKSSIITTLGPAKTYGRRGSAFESISTFGDLAAPLILGVTLDALGFSNTALVIGTMAIALAIIFQFGTARINPPV